MTHQPDAPMTQLEMMAAQMHELYLAYCAAGFTASQAMQMICAGLQANTRGSR